MKQLWLVVLLAFVTGCVEVEGTPRSTSGVSQKSVQVQIDASGATVEQHNVANRLLMDNKPGSIKHLYVISAFSGQVLIYSTVRGKVTSSGKRLAPSSVSEGSSNYYYAIPVDIGGTKRYTTEVLQDDGTYGSSVEYIYWWDTKGVYHQHYIVGGQIVHVSDQPVAVKGIVINMAATTP